MTQGRGWLDVRRLLWLGLAAVLTVQGVTYWSHVESVRKTVLLQLTVYHQSGLRAYRKAVLDALEDMGMDAEELDLRTKEDRANDELRVELRYEWPLQLLFFTLERPNVVRTRTTILGD
jgi:hypothetical protein